jgi:N-acetyl sugar amidotransferase
MNNIFLCKRCLYPSSHPLKITFNEKGICSGCVIHEEKDTLDWQYRLLKLQKIIKEYKTKKNAYDCIIPVTGANDSYYTVHVAKNILKLNPLLVHYNKYYNTPIGIRNLANLRRKFDCDIYFKNINPKVIKKITQETMHMAGSVYWHCLAGHTVYPVQVARDMKIPLIIWGEHQGLQQVGMFSHKNEVEMTRRYRKDHDLMGFEPKDLIKVTNNLTMDDLHPYEYPSDKIINKIGIRGIYLGNYIRWDPIVQHNLMINKFGYKSSKLDRTFDAYDYIDSYIYTGVHDKTKYLKNGYTKITDHVCREIRYKRISREYGIKLINFYENKKDKFEMLFIKWLEINSDGLNLFYNEIRNKSIWKEVSPNKWKKNYPSLKIKRNSLKKNSYKKYYIINSEINYGQEKKYIVFGKGI